MVRNGDRRRGIFWLFLLVFLILLGRLWQLQVLKGEQYRRLSEKNRLRLVKILPPRGRIYDRRGRLLVANRPSFDLLVIPADVRDPQALAEELSGLIDMPEEKILERIRGARGPYEPVRVKKDLSFEELSRVEANLWDLPGVRIALVPVRTYPHGPLASHILGTVGEITLEELKRLRGKGYEVGDFVGKGGVESQWEGLLRGRKGGRQVEVDALGREVRVVKEVRPIAGWDLYLTLDLGLQKEAEKLLEGKWGAIVALDPRNGEVLAMASSPSFDPRDFSRGLDPEKWQELLRDPGHPLTNRAIQGLYAPGSVFKVLVALAALAQGGLKPQQRLYCPGYFPLGRRTFRCWKEGGHGSVDLYRAIVESCDVYFYQVGLELGPQAMVEFARASGFGRPTGIKLPGEKAGYLPSPERGRWYDGDTVVMAIGQGPLLVTPLQMARFVAAVANGGILYRPILVLEARDPLGRESLHYSPKELGRLPVGAGELGRVKRALEGVVEDEHGTGRAARIEGVRVAGKTGTAQVIRTEERIRDPEELPFRYRDHAWFVAYAPAESPTIAVSVLVEHGGTGGRAAAPLAKALIQYWLGEGP